VDTFTKWISGAGETVVAERLGVSRQIVNMWFQRKAAPRPPLAWRIILMAKYWGESPSKLTFEDIYGPYARAMVAAKKPRAKQSKKR
jgi:antibiotic biosynthesis monooxygenase (ABM) superfamily enzyme